MIFKMGEEAIREHFRLAGRIAELARDNGEDYQEALRKALAMAGWKPGACQCTMDHGHTFRCGWVRADVLDDLGRTR